MNSFLVKYKNWFLYFFLAVFLTGYLLFNQPVFGYLVFAVLVALIILDFSPKDGKMDWKASLKELVIALAFAGVAWFALSFLLQTSSPLNVVTSCSMLPELQRGDLIFLQGGSLRVPELNSSKTIAETLSAMNGTRTRCFIGTSPAFCTTSLSFEGKNYSSKPNASRDVIVYEPEPNNIGLIIHRAVLKINAKDGSFYLTKGDNNQVLDQEAQINPVRQEKTLGKVLFRIPLIGYVKLLLFLQFNVPPGCDRTISYQ